MNVVPVIPVYENVVCAYGGVAVSTIAAMPDDGKPAPPPVETTVMVPDDALCDPFRVVFAPSDLTSTGCRCARQYTDVASDHAHVFPTAALALPNGPPVGSGTLSDQAHESLVVLISAVTIVSFGSFVVPVLSAGYIDTDSGADGAVPASVRLDARTSLTGFAVFVRNDESVVKSRYCSSGHDAVLREARSGSADNDAPATKSAVVTLEPQSYARALIVNVAPSVDCEYTDNVTEIGVFATLDVSNDRKCSYTYDVGDEKYWPTYIPKFVLFALIVPPPERAVEYVVLLELM